MVGPVLFIGIGCALAIGLSGAGAAIAAPPAALFVMRHHRHQPVVAWAPMVISGVLSLYGLIIGVILAIPTLQTSTNPDDNHYIDQDTGYRLFSAVLVVELSCLVSGAGIGCFLHRFNTEAVPAMDTESFGEEQPLTKSFVPKQIIPARALIFSLAFMEATGLDGLIIALFLAS
jgi:F0F1-type ATP synthase membrane subunit c/vacuolar-type H+-ATPase subunit K